MINEFDHVKIKSTGITGVVVDISIVAGKTIFVVESDNKGVPGGYGDDASWKLFDCFENDLEKIH